MSPRKPPEAPKYGKVRISKILAAFNELREACRAEGTPRIQDAIDRYEPWADCALARPEHGCTACDLRDQPKIT